MLAKMAKIVSNKSQMSKLVSLMEENLDAARGLCSKVNTQRKWEQFSLILNGLGPPAREWDKWHRVWIDLKCKTKKKKTENKNEISATGGGPNRLHHFTDIEETIIRILQLDTCVDPPGKEFGLVEIVAENINEKSQEVCVEDSLFLNGSEECPCPWSTQKHSSSNKENRKKCSKTEKLQEERKALLQEQTSSQNNFYENMTGFMVQIKKSVDNIEYYTKKNARNIEEILKLKKEKLKVYKEIEKNKDHYNKEKLKLKIQMLEFEKQKQNLMGF